MVRWVYGEGVGVKGGGGEGKGRWGGVRDGAKRMVQRGGGGGEG